MKSMIPSGHNENASPPPRRRGAMRKLRGASMGLAATGVALGGLCYLSYRSDCRRLRAVAEQVVQGATCDCDRVLRLLQYVHAIPRTAENTAFFLLPGLRATPAQVLSGGGDCADRSRLLVAMLREVGTPATMVLCFDENTGAPTHTVVSAVTSQGGMVVDPAYGMHFPKSGGQGYYGLTELRESPTILADRLAELRGILPAKHPVRSYNPRSASYRRASSCNWNKNAMTRVLHSMLHPLAGDELYSWTRPIVLEEPKLFVTALAAGVALISLVLPWAYRRARMARHLRSLAKHERLRTEQVTAGRVAAAI